MAPRIHEMGRWMMSHVISVETKMKVQRSVKLVKFDHKIMVYVRRRGLRESEDTSEPV